ncbi:hypothetical protein F3Y22_tig00110241pilonHSYRG00033 [Hibiscus syriacus]|uniref:ABC transporter domain-containing protein n=1 Tax=Hibiscus syriacus TaxID=106335 RepID=A0A6A3BCT1_HIBSY|nr:hypothetical protein F3Y22_tig00110241pilonHSYRG00033 [Hibiscus syriacus]
MASHVVSEGVRRLWQRYGLPVMHLNMHRGNKPVNLSAGLQYVDLTYTVTKKKKVEGKWLSQEVDLLNKITGYAPKGYITAVMGPSGAGKSTILDALAGHIASGSVKGRVSLDGMAMNSSLIKRTSAYIMQDDRLFPMLTVYETLMFAADFRFGPISRVEKRQHVEKLIDQLGLTYRDPHDLSPSSRIQLLLDHMIVFARGQLMYQGSPSWSTNHIGVVQQLIFTPTRQRTDRKVLNPMSSSPGYYTYSSDILPGMPTPHSSDYTVNEID